MSDLGLAAARIGIEMDYLPAGDLAALQGALPGAAFVPAERLYARSRQLKTAEEIAVLRRLSRIADASITDAFAAVAAGATEMDIAAAMTRGIEPLVYRTPYGFGMQNKDMVLVTPTGSELLSDYADTDRLIVVR